MATTMETRPRRREERTTSPPVERFDSLGDLAKFTGVVALLAILSDAAVGHALLWENDPYWTYWVTKTFLIATVFGLGSAWLGAGLARGAVVTAIHTLVLTVYYWSLSPIGLPSHPEWLDLQHTWVTGLPVHFGVIYLGYVTALWLWRRRPRIRDAELRGSVAAEAGRALAVGAMVVVVGGGLEALALGDFPGVTWFVVRLLIAVPFTLAWWAAAGQDRAAAVAGGLMLTWILVTYSHFLGPVGLPDTDLRLLAQDPPPAPVEWLSYREEFLVAFPITAVVAVAAYLAAVRREERWVRIPLSGAGVLGTAVAVVALVALGAVAARETGPGDEATTVTSSGQARVEEGPFYRGTLAPTEAELHFVAEQRNPRVTPLPPHDRVELRASVVHPNGTRFEVRATEPMVDDPLGRFGTWWGVGLDRWHHGRSGIGSPLVPATRSEVAVFALGDVRADGELVATGVPVHAMTMEGDGLSLDVGDPASPVPSLPDGHLRVVWDDRRGDSPEAPERARNALGSAVLAALLLLAVAAARTEQPRAR